MRRAQDIGGRALQETRQKEREKKRFRHRRNKRFVELKGVSAEMLTLYIGGGRQWGSGSCPSSSLPDKEGLLGGRGNACASGHSPQPPPKNTNTPAAPQVTDDCPGASPRLISSTSRLAPSSPGGDGRIRSRSNAS
ncbi:uncharacterized protein LOC119590015 [Penaeus monodon]|uniref:uncharacterized protein LOC119590015 n=1 Tax=Penaeus monodon TaxID=6687 RepID=UPI0018A72F50|nr:uncharacterized protein LOC119590015 [Penaeus monodon]